MCLVVQKHAPLRNIFCKTKTIDLKPYEKNSRYIELKRQKSAAFKNYKTMKDTETFNVFNDAKKIFRKYIMIAHKPMLDRLLVNWKHAGKYSILSTNSEIPTKTPQKSTP